MSPTQFSLTTNVVRDLSTFPGYPEFPFLPAPQLDSWLCASRIRAISALEWNWPRGWRVGPRTVNDSMYFWFASGSADVSIQHGAHRFHLSAGDLMLIPKGMEHDIHGCSNDEPHVYAVHFYAELFGSIDLLDMLGFPVHMPNRRGSPYRQISERLVREYAVKAPGYSAAMATDIWQLLHFMIRHESGRFTPPATVGFQSELPRLLPVLQWIEDNLASHELTVNDLAEQVHLSETHFRRLFHQVFGTSPVQFIRKRRIDRACALLRSSDMPIKQIAENCGFADDAFFSRVFHHFVGNSPAAYRKLELV